MKNKKQEIINDDRQVALDLQEPEIWKDIEGYEGLYEVSNYGRIKSKKFKNKEKIIKSFIGSNGYPTITLYSNNHFIKKFSIHRLVAQAFIPNPNNYPQVNHIDLNKFNNFYSNLEWCTHNMNIQHAVYNGRYRGENNGAAKLTEDGVKYIRHISNLPKNTLGYADLGKIFNVAESTIRSIINRKIWKHIE